MLIKVWLTYDSDMIWTWSHICLKLENTLLHISLMLLKPVFVIYSLFAVILGGKTFFINFVNSIDTKHEHQTGCITKNKQRVNIKRRKQTQRCTKVFKTLNCAHQGVVWAKLKRLFKGSSPWGTALETYATTGRPPGAGQLPPSFQLLCSRQKERHPALTPVNTLGVK